MTRPETRLACQGYQGDGLLDYLLAPENLTFALASGLLALVGVVQILSFIFGFGVFDGLDDWFGGDVDLSFDHTPTFGEALLSLLGVGKVPVAFTFLFFLFSYASFGYGLQWIVGTVTADLWPAWLASIIAFIATLPTVRLGNELLAKVIPTDESLAVSEDSFVGKLATITIGTVTYERSAEAKLEDEHGRTHYVQVLSDSPEDTFRSGEEVVIVGRRRNQFTVVRGPTAFLLEE